MAESTNRTYHSEPEGTDRSNKSATRSDRGPKEGSRGRSESSGGQHSERQSNGEGSGSGSEECRGRGEERKVSALVGIRRIDFGHRFCRFGILLVLERSASEVGQSQRGGGRDDGIRGLERMVGQSAKD